MLKSTDHTPQGKLRRKSEISQGKHSKEKLQKPLTARKIIVEKSRNKSKKGMSEEKSKSKSKSKSRKHHKDHSQNVKDKSIDKFKKKNAKLHE